jgi:hypothetical protein
VGQGCVVAPNAVINARVVLEDGVYVGSNASILPDLRIGAGATIAANTLVLCDVPAGATALGVPATLMQASVAGTMTAAVEAPETTAPTASAGSPVDTATLEADIAAAMREVLSLADVPRGANFFDLGGTSLKAIQLSRRLGERHRPVPGHQIRAHLLHQHVWTRTVPRHSNGDHLDVLLQRTYHDVVRRELPKSCRYQSDALSAADERHL